MASDGYQNNHYQLLRKERLFYVHGIHLTPMQGGYVNPHKAKESEARPPNCGQQPQGQHRSGQGTYDCS
jgi:hypothetical protein